MRNLMKLLLMVAMVFALASCGKKDESSSSPAPAPSTSGNGEFYGNGENAEFGNYETLRNYYETKSFADGTSDNLVVYHIGPDYGMSTSSSTFEFGLCIDLFGNQIGDCSSNNNDATMQNIIDNGKYKIVRSSSTSGNSYDLAVGVSNGVMQFESRNHDTQSEIFREMLNLDNQAVAKVIVSKAQIRLTTGELIDGDYVEYFYTNNTYKGYVLAKSLPLIANPAATVKDYNSGITGMLNNVSTKVISSVQVTRHNLQFNHLDGSYTVYSTGVFGMTIN